jgi:hypothetical protein
VFAEAGDGVKVKAPVSSNAKAEVKKSQKLYRFFTEVPVIFGAKKLFSLNQLACTISILYRPEKNWVRPGSIGFDSRIHFSWRVDFGKYRRANSERKWSLYK